MKKIFYTIALCLAVCIPASYAHHATEDIADEEIYRMIDSLVADTPQSEMTLDDLGNGMMEMTITAHSVFIVEDMMDEGLLYYLSMLDGDVAVTIHFRNPSGLALKVSQKAK